MRSNTLARTVAVAFALSSLVAQTTITVARAPVGTRTRPMEPSGRTLAMTADGACWALVWSDDASSLATTRQLRLHRSLDGGTTWSPQTAVATSGNSVGSVTAANACDRLHVCWSATDTSAFYSAYYQEFDTTSLAWVGAPQRLLQGQGANDQYYARDVAVTPAGTVAVACMAHRSPTTAPVGGWSGSLMVRPAGTPVFQGPLQINTDATGVHTDLQAVGEVVHAAFRTSSGGYGVRYRAFDTATMSFVQGADVPLDGAAQSQMNASNANCIAADSDGNLYVLYARGATGAGLGEIRMAYAAAGSTSSWTSQQVATDPDMLRGNVTYVHYSLSRVGSDSVMALYSKLTGEQHQNLYMRLYAGGVALTPEILLIAGAGVDEFRIVSGFRSQNTLSNVLVAYGDGSTSVQFARLSGVARAVRLGTGCATAQGVAPRLSTRTEPTLGSTLDLRVDGGAPSGAGILFVGNLCYPVPQPLTPYGLTGCELYHDIAGSVLFTTDASGVGAIPIAIPSSATYVGVPIYVGALALIPGANPQSAVTTNSQMVWIE